MTHYYWPINLPPVNAKRFKPEEHYDITEERYIIPLGIEFVSLEELIQYPYIELNSSAISNLCNSMEYSETHAKNDIIIASIGHEFHSTTFETIKSSSSLIHSCFGLSPIAIVELARVMRIHEGINNHSYVRCCPEMIFSISQELKQELLNLNDEQLCLLATDWQKAVLTHYEDEDPISIKRYFFGWRTIYEFSHYTIEYFAQTLLNIYELLRYCEEDESLYFSVDY